MYKHEFYAEPTVFDQWQDHADNWFGVRCEKLQPFSWAIGFSLLATVFTVVALGVLVYPVQADPGVSAAVSWNRTLAQFVTFLLALAATGGLLKQAVVAWPAHVNMPRLLRIVARYSTAVVPRAVSEAEIVAVPVSRGVEQSLPVNAALIREFFVSVRAAGVNVSIAKALFEAGVRTSAHLRRASNQELLAIRGVGSASIHKLRARFGSE